MKKSSVAVVIPAYNEAKTILSTLEALAVQDFAQSWHLIVVDNNSTDDTRQIADNFAAKFPHQMDVISEVKKGTGAACRAGFQLAIDSGADVIARIDADTVPANDWLKKGLEKFDNPAIQMVAGRCQPLRDNDYRLGDTTMVRVGELPMRLLVGFSAMLRQPRHWRAINFAIGSNMFIRACGYQAAGGFRPTAIEQADEDIDLSLRVMDEYGFRAIHHARGVVVYNSMRRMRQLGWVRTIAHHVIGPHSQLVRSQHDVR